MRKFFVLLIATLGFFAQAHAQEAVDVPEIRSVIDAQVQAFKAEDAVTAFTFASPRIKQLFGTVENFAAMVQGSYPMVWNPDKVVFFDQAQRGAIIWQRVLFVDQAGAEHWFAYEMVPVGETWKINGVYPVEATNLSA